jgi:hypothetical protein
MSPCNNIYLYFLKKRTPINLNNNGEQEKRIRLLMTKNIDFYLKKKNNEEKKKKRH